MTFKAAAGAPEREPNVMRFAVSDSSLGLVLVAQSAKGISAVLLGDDRDTLRDDLQHRYPFATLTDGDTTLDALCADVVNLVESPLRGLNATLDMRGSEFQREVWRALRSVPAGSTTTYTEVARRIGSPKSVRAVARACAANPLAVVVPCHRVLRRDGQLSGYRWGIERKRELLAREAAAS
ncbi:MAG TPA: methylated-DNA--[protein]-cysteine S-methyltransferase [Gemmatimonadaceae bacterium]